MDSLVKLSKKYKTDKGTKHSYLSVYDDLFLKFRDKKINIFEVGYYNGESSKLFVDYFPGSKIRSIDINHVAPKPRNPQIQLDIISIQNLTSSYFDDFIPDIAIDDGSHKLEDQLRFVELLYPITKELVIVEDIQKMEYIKEFEKLNIPFEVIDLRKNKGRYDDVLLIFDKCSNPKAPLSNLTIPETIGVVIVCCNTPGIVTRAVNSVINHVDSIILVDNSDKENKCYAECDELSRHEKVNVKHTGKNIGHGPGLNLGIGILQTDIIICMDSDCYVIDPSIIDEMKDALGDGVYGSGKVTGEHLKKPKNRPTWYHLHPYFCMFKKETFLKHKSFFHNGAPFKNTMKEIRKKLTVKNIESIEDKVIHEGKATRKVVKHWRKGFGGRPGI